MFIIPRGTGFVYWSLYHKGLWLCLLFIRPKGTGYVHCSLYHRGLWMHVFVHDTTRDSSCVHCSLYHKGLKLCSLLLYHKELVLIVHYTTRDYGCVLCLLQATPPGIWFQENWSCYYHCTHFGGIAAYSKMSTLQNKDLLLFVTSSNLAECRNKNYTCQTPSSKTSEAASAQNPA